MIYQGYEFQVPASWPVYRLDEHPNTCVRYDVYAVYLGNPGADMQCPAGLVGRTETVSFIPGQTAPESGTDITYQRAQLAGADGVALRRLPAVSATLTENAAQYELKVALAHGATVLGTYASNPASMKQILETLRPAPAGAAATQQSVPAQAPPRPSAPSKPARSPGAQGAAPAAPAAPGGKSSPVRTLKRTPVPPKSATRTSWFGVPANWPVQVVQPPPAPPRAAFHPVLGFDTCDSLSPAMLTAWRSKYAVIGRYIGGVNAGCPPVNLSASWIKTAQSMGFGIMPTYVGPQAPCWKYSGTHIVAGKAAAQGKAAALDAVGDARLFGLNPGSPIYYDMEGYIPSASCTGAVLKFLGAWDRQLAASGYVSGVYSSLLSGIDDMELGIVKHAAGFTPPAAIWMGDWRSGPPSLGDDSLAWPLSDRSKQYAGNVKDTIGGYTLYIDQDYVGGPVAR